MLEILGGIAVFAIMVILSGIKVVKEYDRMIIFRGGKQVIERGPGIQLVLPVVDKAELVDTRIVTLPSTLIQATTSDNMSVKVSALCMYQIVDAKRALCKVENVKKSTAELAEMALRTAVGNNDLLHLISDRKRINFNLKNIVDRQTKEFGIRIVKIELKDVRLSKDMRKALARSNKPGHAGHANHVDTANVESEHPQSLDLNTQQSFGELMKHLG